MTAVAPYLRAPRFAGWASLATMHGKERAIAPVLLRELHVPVQVAPEVDTDALGTFTGETPRAGSARDAALAKARLALRHAPEANYGLGSEGSFGPHPLMPFVTAGRELVALVSRDEELVLVGHDATTDTKCAEAIVTSVGDAFAVARCFGFPSHGAVVTGVRAGRSFLEAGLLKGLVSADALRDAVEETIARCGAACIQSDMRAHFNPTRMRAIERATTDLARLAMSLCRACGHPGYDVIEHVPGLPCEECDEPTDLTRFVVYGCSRCRSREDRPRADGRLTARPGECPSCNP